MSQQQTGLKRSISTILRYKILVSAVTAAGLVIGIVFTVLRPPLPTSEALIVIPQSAPTIATEVVVADSEPVLSGALHSIRPPMSLQTLESSVHVKSITPGVISVSAEGTTRAQADSAANAVAHSYIDYVGKATYPVGHIAAKLLSTTTATGAGSVNQDITDGLLGVLAGLVAGMVLAVIIGRFDRRLRRCDDIANSIGVPVLAAVPAARPPDAAGWRRLLEGYEPGVVEAWRLRQALQSLGFTGANVNDLTAEGGFSLTVLSMASDPKALALGPQLAVFAASIRIPTVLVIGPQQDTNATAALRTACASPLGSSKRASYLQTVAADSGSVATPYGAKLIVVVTVVDGKTPQMPVTMPTTTTVLAVSVGAGTAEQFARIATVAAADGREVAGFLVADPESADKIMGRIPLPARPVRRVPGALAGPN